MDTSDNAAPDVSMAQQGPPPSVLGQTVAPTMPNPQSPGSPMEQQTDADLSGPQNGGGGGSRLLAILSAVAKVGSTGLAGIPQGRRPDFVSGLGSGARAEQPAQATDRDIKMQDFNTSVRIANLHRQDLAQQQQDDAQDAAQQAAQDFQKEAFDDPNNLKYNPHPNDGDAVIQTLKAQTAANGSASIAPGTHVNADGEIINVPSNDPATLQAQVKKYKSLEGIIPYLPTLPGFDPSSVKSTQDVLNARNELGKHIDIMTHVLEGHNVNGEAFTHAQLNNIIPALQAQRDSLAKSGGATPYQLGTVDHLLDIYKANEANHQAAEDSVAAKVAQQKKDLQDNASDDATQQKLTLQQNAAALKPPPKTDTNMYVGTDANNNQIAGTMNDLQSAGAQGVTKLDADTQKKVIVSRQLVAPNGLFLDVKNDMTQLENQGKLGNVASRWNNFMAGKLGDDPDFAALNTHMGLLSTALMQAHVGARGSSEMLEHFQNLMNQKISTPQQLKAQLNAAYSYVKEKAMVPKVNQQ